MEDHELKARLDALDAKLDGVEKYARKTYKIMLWTGIVTVALIVLPMIGLVFVIPSFVSTYTNIGNMQ